MNRYAVLRRKQEQEIHALPIGFAFGNRQFEELMRRWGFDPEKDLDKIYRLGDTGGFYKRTDAQLIRDTLHKYEEELQAAIAEDDSIIPGNPILFGNRYFEELLTLPDNHGGNVLLKKYPDVVRYFPAGDPLELADADTPAELEQLKKAEFNR